MTTSVRLRPAVAALLIGLGLALAAAGDGRCDPVREEIDATRQSIIQGVRDDIQRRVKQQSRIDSAGRTEVVSQPVPPHRVKKTLPK
ncbi:hypothetical protein SAMN05444159_4957 [Bradyrhizobium lablabi]|uniref:Uncharacterized protein n=1 Tax=Bradyrhizobium lablabi TaxID=722472 RepID=A0A1M6XRX1_9BRAD|nr:hypothetical protein SAMN05444159_4957 [Bradyrhizobium lablabi]